MSEPIRDFEPEHDYKFSGRDLIVFTDALDASLAAYRRAVVLLALFGISTTITIAVLTDAATAVVAGGILVALGVAIILDGAKAGRLLAVPPSTKKET